MKAKKQKKAKSQKELKAERRAKRWYGMKKVKRGEKVCWLAKEDKNGWSLGLALGERTLWLRNLRFPSHKEVSRILGANVVFVYLAGNDPKENRKSER